MQWIFFQYTVPNKPSKLRVYVWRKLKTLRAEKLLEGLYALPLTDKTVEQFEWLSAEVSEMNGYAVLWKAECKSKKQEQNLINSFKERSAKDYEEIQDMLLHTPEQSDKNWIDSIIRKYADVRYHDYFDMQKNYDIHIQLEQHYRLQKRGGKR